jgi:hypothetical protein
VLTDKQIEVMAQPFRGINRDYGTEESEFDYQGFAHVLLSANQTALTDFLDDPDDGLLQAAVDWVQKTRDERDIYGAAYRALRRYFEMHKRLHPTDNYAAPPVYEREAFEAHIRNRFIKDSKYADGFIRRDKTPEGEYSYPRIQGAWEGWQARAALKT